MGKVWRSEDSLRRRRLYNRTYRLSQTTVQREANRARSARWNKLNKVVQRESHLRLRYDLTLEQFSQMVVDQHGQCAICGRTPSLLRVDHDHTTNKVRALLCGACNRGIGLLQEDSVVLRAAMKYLEEHDG
jgi:hypothetical protein